MAWSAIRKCQPEMSRFPPPWTIEPPDAGYKVVDASGQAFAYVATLIFY
jgi:hypothetical protein